MPTQGDAELEAALIAAAEAPPEIRIEYRDPIARFGDAAVARLNSPEWIGDPPYARFAVRTIARAMDFGATTSIAVLRQALKFVGDPELQAFIEADLTRLGAKLPTPSRGRSSPKSHRSHDSLSVDELVVGRRYGRRDLHLSGLGGNWQRGISYPADGTYVLLFSDPSSETSYGYRDSRVGEDGYRYFGGWDGPGDMALAGGNKAVVDRSPELYLFTRTGSLFEFSGRYECTGFDWEPANHDGIENRAIVFALHRVG